MNQRTKVQIILSTGFLPVLVLCSRAVVSNLILMSNSAPLLLLVSANNNRLLLVPAKTWEPGYGCKLADWVPHNNPLQLSYTVKQISWSAIGACSYPSSGVAETLSRPGVPGKPGHRQQQQHIHVKQTHRQAVRTASLRNINKSTDTWTLGPHDSKCVSF